SCLHPCVHHSLRPSFPTRRSSDLNKLVEKYNNLIRNSLYVTSLEANEDYNQRNKLASFNYVSLDYSSIPDADVKLTDQDYKDFYNENKHRFKNPEETRTIEYILFDANPSAADKIGRAHV